MSIFLKFNKGHFDSKWGAIRKFFFILLYAGLSVMYARECVEYTREFCKSETVIKKNKSDIMDGNRKVSLNTTLSGILVKVDGVDNVKYNDVVTVSEKFGRSKTDSTLAIAINKNNFIASVTEIVISIFSPQLGVVSSTTS